MRCLPVAALAAVLLAGCARVPGSSQDDAPAPAPDPGTQSSTTAAPPSPAAVRSPPSDASAVDAPDAPTRPASPAASATSSSTDLFALPGPLDADTDPAALRRIYGADNVRIGEVPLGEGEHARGVILFADDPTRRAYVYFQDDRKLEGLGMISVVDASSRWHTAQGIRIGMPLARLRAINGGPFEFLGFDWDYGGQVSDWLGGKLATPAGEPSLRLVLAPGETPKDVSYDKLPIGDRSFRSDHPQLARMKVTVAGMSVVFPGRDDQ